MNTLTQHKHHDLIIERARQDASGETAAGWWKWDVRLKKQPQYLPLAADYPAWHANSDYQYRMTPAHPYYEAPKPKLINMSKLPKGSVVLGDYGAHAVVVKCNPGTEYTWVLDGALIPSNVKSGDLRIAEQKDFTYWGGGECPVPDGVNVQVVFRSGQTLAFTNPTVQTWAHAAQHKIIDVIGYRIIGAADGWTDDPEQAK